MKRSAMVLGFLMMLNIFVMLSILPSIMSAPPGPQLSKKFVLFVEFEGGFRETDQPADFFDPFKPKPLTVHEIISVLDNAADDARVQGIIARMNDGAFSLAHIQEVRGAVKRFRESGKFAHIYSSSYGAAGAGLGRYYLASSFDEIWMQPLGIVTISGVSAEMPFMRGLLDKLGIYPEFFKRKEYKTAYENITDSKMSRFNRLALELMIDDVKEVMLSEIPADRGLEKDTFVKLVDQGLFTAQEAEEAGLISHADYGDVLLSNISEAVIGDRDYDELDLVGMEEYAVAIRAEKVKAQSSSKVSKIALVHVSGAIMYEGEGGFTGGSDVAAANTIAPAILKAAKDSNVEAIVLRVDSPGGSPAASESILRAVERAQKEYHTPVYVSMGSVAASGGYWVSAYADRIFVNPTTITGSIGVVGGKFSIGGLSEKIGVNWQDVSWGQNAGMWSPVRPFGKSGSERVNAMMDSVYQNFIERVAKGRGMELEAVDKIAGGRVWTGKRAVKIGLADEIGGLPETLNYVAKELGLKNRNDLQVQIYPKPKTALEQFVDLLEGQVMIGQELKTQAKFLQSVSAVTQPAMQIYQIHQDEPVSAYAPLELR